VTWIEQGRSVQPSTSVLDRLAEVLQLSAAERAYLFHLAGRADPTRPRTGMTVALPPPIEKLVRAQQYPTYVLDRYWNLPIWNDAASSLFMGWLDRAADTDDAKPNLLQFLFLSEIARTLIVDWEIRARRLTAEFRSDVGKYLDDPGLHHLVSALSAASEEFRQFWTSQDVLKREGGVRVFLHATLGRIAFEQLTLVPSIGMDFKLVVLLPQE
jgi:transcriptional regulator with XRE-family HTH domain